MKDSRFKELLNLYLDHRLNPVDAAELEAEVARNPDRRRVYNGYCRMQRACTVLFESECDQAPASFALARALSEVERKLSDPSREVHGRQVVWLRWSGALAAACVVVVSATVFMGESQSLDTAAPTVASDGGRSTVDGTPAPVAMQPAVMVAAAGPSQTVTVPAQIALAAVEPSAEAVQQSRIAAQRWIDAEAAALVANHLVDDGRFEIRHTQAADDLPSFTSSRQLGASPWRGELTAFQFQR